MKKQVLKPDKFYERILQSNGNYLIADYKEEVLTKEVEIEGVRWRSPLDRPKECS